MTQHEDYSNSSRALFRYITKEKRDVTAIYIYAILSGLVQLSIPLGIQAIVSFVMRATMITSLYLLISFVVLGTFLAGLFRVRVMQIIEKIQQKIFVEYAVAFTERLPNINLSANKKYYLPELVNRFFEAPHLQKGISKILLEIPTALIQILFGILLLSFYNTWFLVFGALVIIIVIIIFRFTMNSGIKSSIEESDRKYEVASWLEDIAGDIKTFKGNSKSKLHLIGTDERVVDYLKIRTTHFKVLEFQYKAIIAFKVIMTLVMLTIGTYLLVNQQLNIGAFIATEIVVLSMMTAVEKLIKSLESYYDVIASLVKLNKVTSLVTEQGGDIDLNNDSVGLDIVFKDVNFAFSDNKVMLSNVNFHIAPNTLTTVSGKLGAGKSLLLNIITGFYEPFSGSILFDKVPLKNLDKVSLRNQIGIFMEDMKIIKGTLKDNILLGNTQINTNDIVNLCEEIGIENLSTQFSEGFSTHLSETDTQISFSAKKKILLIRALLGKRRLLVLEDPLSGMDAEFGGKILAYINRIKDNSTVIIVSNKTKILEIADQKLIIDQGQVMINQES